MKHLKKYNEDIDSDFNDNDEPNEQDIIDSLVITFDGVGAQYYESQTSVSYIINGKDYAFNIIEKGEVDGRVSEIDFVCESDLPFELTQGLKDELYQIYTDNCGF